MDLRSQVIANYVETLRFSNALRHMSNTIVKQYRVDSDMAASLSAMQKIQASLTVKLLAVGDLQTSEVHSGYPGPSIVQIV
jgi:hypothetical protein